MKDFLDWCFSPDAPAWVSFPMFFATVVMLAFYVGAAVFMFVYGLWIVSLLMMFGVPVYVALRAYGEHRRKQK